MKNWSSLDLLHKAVLKPMLDQVIDFPVNFVFAMVNPVTRNFQMLYSSQSSFMLCTLLVHK